MPSKTPSKRKAEAVTFEDDAAGGSGSDDNGNGSGEGEGENVDNGGAGAAASTAKTTPKGGTPQKQKTPGSSPGMTMRSGRKKKRPKPDAAAVGGATPSRKRARKAAGGGAKSEDAAETKTNGQSAGRGKKTTGEEAMDEDEDVEMEDEGGDNCNGEGSSAEEDEDDAMEEESTAKNKGEPTETTRKVPPEDTRKAVAAAQVTEAPSGEKAGEGGADEGDGDASAAAPSGAPPNGGGGGGGGLLRLVSQTLRLPSQRTPGPPGDGSTSSGSPAPPPGGRRLIFTTAKKAVGSDGAGTKNQLLLQTRRQQQSARTTREGKAPTEREEPRSRQRQQQSRGAAEAEESPSLLDHLWTEWGQNREAITRDAVLYTKGWCLLLLAFFVLGNVANVVFAHGSTEDPGWLGSWNVRAQRVQWGEWYGIRPVGNTTGDGKGADGVVVHTETMMDPALLSSARATLRAQRMNLNDVQKMEQGVAELEAGVDALNAELEAWKGLHPEFDFERGALQKAEEKGGADAKGRVIEEINSSDVVVFSKSYCPHCKATKKLFQNMGQEARVVELDLLPDDEGGEMQSALLELTGQKTVPNVFIRGRHAGGNDDVQGLARSGELKGMLAGDFVEIPPQPPAAVEETKRDGKVTSYEKIDRMKSTIATRKNLLLEWEWALVDAEEALDLLQRGVVLSEEVNEATSALSKVSMVPVETAALDAEKTALAGEGCDGLDYVPSQSKGSSDNEATDATEVVEVVGGIDVDALDLASDTPVRLDEAQIAYDGLARLAEAETLVGGASAIPSRHAQRWIDQVVAEDLQTKGVDDKPPSIEELYPLPEIPGGTTASSSSVGGLYNARVAVRDVDRLLEGEAADRTGQFDYASVVNGAHVVRRGPYATSYSYYETLPMLNRILAFTKFRFYGHGPEAALVPKTGPAHGRGQCWSFPDESSSARARKRALDGTNGDILGEHATLTVSLASAIVVTEVVIEHLIPSSDSTAAIREFRVLGFEDSGAYADPWELGTFAFSLDGGDAQAFAVPTMLDGQNVPRLKAMGIAVDSSNGANYSCLYRVRVHGQP